MKRIFNYLNLGCFLYFSMISSTVISSGSGFQGSPKEILEIIFFLDVVLTMLVQCLLKSSTRCFLSFMVSPSILIFFGCSANTPLLIRKGLTVDQNFLLFIIPLLTHISNIASLHFCLSSYTYFSFFLRLRKFSPEVRLI